MRPDIPASWVRKKLDEKDRRIEELEAELSRVKAQLSDILQGEVHRLGT